MHFEHKVTKKGIMTEMKIKFGLKKVFCVALCFILVINMTAVFAFAEDEFEDEKMVGNVSESVDALINGDPDFLVGDGVLLGSDYDMYFPQDDNSHIDYSSGGYDHTHQYIVANAIKILANDFGAGVYQIPENSTLLLEGADYPDKKETFGIFQWHFYDPETEKSFNVFSKYPAHLKAMNWYNDGVEAYKRGDVSEAMSCLGRATHYMADINEPHHASNRTAVDSNHSSYESFCDDTRKDYFIEGYTLGDYQYRQVLNMGLHNFIRSHAYGSKSLFDSVKGSTGTTLSIEGSHACVENAIVNVTQLMYRFAVDVGIYEAV